MSREAIREYFKAIYGRYQKASKKLKHIILEEFCSNTGYNRKYAIRKLNGPAPTNPGSMRRRRRKHTYTEEVPSKSAGRETVAVDQCKADRPQTQTQKGTNRQAYLRTYQTWDPVEASHSDKDRQLGYKDAGLDRSGHCVTFWEQCRGKVCLYNKSNRHSDNVGREPGCIGQGRRCDGRRT